MLATLLLLGSLGTAEAIVPIGDNIDQQIVDTTGLPGWTQGTLGTKATDAIALEGTDVPQAIRLWRLLHRALVRLDAAGNGGPQAASLIQAIADRIACLEGGGPCDPGD